MTYINENFLNLQESYLFSTIAKKVEEYKKENPDKEVIKLGIGDVTKPIVPECIEAMHKAVDEIPLAHLAPNQRYRSQSVPVVPCRESARQNPLLWVVLHPPVALEVK